MPLRQHCLFCGSTAPPAKVFPILTTTWKAPLLERKSAPAMSCNPPASSSRSHFPPPAINFRELASPKGVFPPSARRAIFSCSDVNAIVVQFCAWSSFFFNDQVIYLSITQSKFFQCASHHSVFQRALCSASWLFYKKCFRICEIYKIRVSVSDS